MVRKSKNLIHRPDYDENDEQWDDFKLMIHVFVIRDMKEINDYWSPLNPRKLQRIMDEIDLESRRIEADPYSYMRYHVEGVNKILAKPYLIFYVIRPPFIIILRIRHGARQSIDKQLQRLANAKKLNITPYSTFRMKN